MNIVIDQGNTSTKLAVFDKHKMLGSFMFKSLDSNDLNKLLNKYSPSKGILSYVSEPNSEVVALLQSRLIHFLVLDENVSIPVRIEYKTPRTLGKDRIAAVVGAWKKNPGKPSLIIDAGTAITYDFLDASGIYSGGNISPGMKIRFRALHAYTGQLPLLDEHGDLPLMGYNTETAVRSGVVWGIVKEMDDYIRDYQSDYPDLLVFLTGGHSFYFETKLKNSIFADNNLVLQGLNEIINYQNEVS